MNDKMTTFDFTLNYKQIDFDIIMELILLCKYVYHIRGMLTGLK